MAICVTGRGQWNLALIYGELNALHLQNNLLCFSGSSHWALCCLQKKETTYLLFNISRHKDNKETSRLQCSFRKAPGQWEWQWRKHNMKLCFIVGGSQLCGVMTPKGKVVTHFHMLRLLGLSVCIDVCSVPLTTGWNWTQALHRNGFLMECFSLYTGISRAVLKTACHSTTWNGFAVIHAPFIVICNFFSCAGVFPQGWEKSVSYILNYFRTSAWDMSLTFVIYLYVYSKCMHFQDAVYIFVFKMFYFWNSSWLYTIQLELREKWNM